ncbi:MAG: D-alanyl-D-alanine carboxypeptidase [Clostridia bacterium]|nr:D-alanyl-D-alanine carboxypeptidase [Clostridia bacterium]
MKKIICVILATLILPCFSICAATDSAVSSVVINADTGEVLYSKNENCRLAMASTTKIMTALLLIENTDLNKNYRVEKEAVTVEGTSMGLKAGDIVSGYDLLYGMMLSSGNDAANMAAIAVAGSIKDFVKLMNKRAKELGLIDTSFATPSGLDSDTHYTTATDLARLTMYAIKNPDFAACCREKYKTLNFGVPATDHTLKNHNKLLFLYDDIIGVKTGFTKKAGRCLVSSAKREDKTVIAVTLKDKNDWADHRALLDLGFSLIDSGKREITPPDLELKTSDGKSVKISLPGYKYYEKNKLNVSYKTASLPFVHLPLEKGEYVGYIEYYVDLKKIKRQNVYTKENIGYTFTNFSKYITIVKIILSQPGK